MVEAYQASINPAAYVHSLLMGCDVMQLVDSLPTSFPFLSEKDFQASGGNSLSSPSVSSYL
eukprot:scaffold412382_cov15-Prasinocladus_malaysianus.AAC.1